MPDYPDSSERMEATNALRQSEALFRQVFEQSPLGKVMVGLDRRFMRCNQAFLRFVGYSHEELVGTDFLDITWHEDRSIGLAEMREIVAGKIDRYQVQKRYVRKDGQVVWAEVTIALIRDAQGQPLFFLPVIQDITARHEAERARREAEVRFRDLFERGPIAVAYHRMVYDATGRPIDYFFLDANDNYLRLTGVDPRGKLVTQAFPGIENDPFDWIGKFGHVASTGETIRLQQHLQANDRWYDCVGYQTGPGMFVAAFLEITDRMRAEAALRSSEENLRVTFASIGDAVIATDASGRITRMNLVAERLTGWPLAEATGRPLPEVFHIINARARQPVENPVDRVLSTGEIVGLANHTVLIARDGTERQIADSGAPIRSDAGNIIGVVLVFRDVTAEYALQEQVRQSQKMDAIGQLAGGVAHDFNNMLGGILGGAELLRRHIRADDDKGQRHLDMILHATGRATDLTRQLLSFARRQPTELVPMDAHRAVQAAAALLARTTDRRIHIKLCLTAADARILGDMTLLESVFLNLGINATHAMPHGGVLEYRSEVVVLDEAARAAAGIEAAPGRFLAIEARDTGCGIPPDILPRIFEPFFTTKPQGQGTGLGLSAALGSIQQHQGAITVTSEVGKGTCVRVLLPLTQHESPLVNEVAAEDVTHPGGLILLIDDEPALRELGTTILSEAGYQVLTAEDGAAGIAIYRQRQGAVRLVILDMIMPIMDGRDCIRALRAIDPEVRIIVATGFSGADNRADLAALGLAGVLAKPYRAADLLRLTARALTGTAGSSSSSRPSTPKPEGKTPRGS